MKPNIYSILAAAALTTLCACEKDNPFNSGTEEGHLDCKSLKVDYANRENTVRSRAVELGDFNVAFVNTETGDTTRRFKYSDMPEIVALPIGSYRAVATYGTNPIAEWEKPYYLGNTSFDIEANKITDIEEPISCKLSNIKVTIDFNDEGSGKIGDDAQVVVSAGQEGSLTFKKGETRSGYFKHVEGSTTLTATFSGTVDGKYVEGETKAYDNATSGNHYKVNFSVHSADNTEPGDITGTINVDGTVTIIDQNETIDPNDTDRDYVTDDMRPVENPDQGGDEPGPDEPGNDDPQENKLPTIDGLEGTMIDKVNDGNSIASCKFKATSHHPDGFTAFTVDIDSPTLTPDELAGMGLTSHLDLVHDELNINGESIWGILGNEFFNFPVNIGGKNEAVFDITAFLGLLSALGDGTHTFKLTVTDGNGTSINSVIIEYK